MIIAHEYSDLYVRNKIVARERKYDRSKRVCERVPSQISTSIRCDPGVKWKTEGNSGSSSSAGARVRDKLVPFEIARLTWAFDGATHSIEGGREGGWGREGS